jgi:hypothetical protein
MINNMLYRTNPSEPGKSKLRIGAVLLLVILVVSMIYLVMRKDPGEPPPVPSPNFKSVNESPL